MSSTQCNPGAPPGFTLIEVLIALTIGSMVVLMVHQAFGATGDLVVRLDDERAAHRTRMHAVERLTRSFGSLDVATAQSTGFEGGADHAAFTSDGEYMRLAVRDGRLTIQTATGVESLLTAESLALDYLLSHGADASWVRDWQSPVSAPLAVRLRVTSGGTVDTLFFLIGPRG